MATAVIEAPGIADEPTPSIGALLMRRRRRITVDDYHRILDAGIFGPEPKVELLEGMIVEKTRKTPPHAATRDLLGYLLHDLLPRGCGYFGSMTTPVTIEERDGQPEPDAAILRGHFRDYASRRRTPADVAQVIEVADASYDYDRRAKWVTYAAARVPVYWIVDVNRRRLEVHTEPTGEGESAVYARTQIFGPDGEVPLTLDGCEFGRFLVREILP